MYSKTLSRFFLKLLTTILMELLLLSACAPTSTINQLDLLIQSMQVAP